MDVGVPRTFADLSTVSVLVEVDLGAHLDSSHVNEGPSEANKLDHFVVTNRLPGPRHRQGVTFTCNRIPIKRPPNRHTQ